MQKFRTISGWRKAQRKVVVSRIPERAAYGSKACKGKCFPVAAGARG